MPKPTVHYVPHPKYPPAVGQRAYVYGLDHPLLHPIDQRVYGISTSEVIRVEADGTFETLNSIYVKAKERSET